MGAVLLLAGGELRRRWPALVALGVLAGLACGVVLVALLGARRTATAFDRLQERTSYWDAQVEGMSPEQADDVASLPMVDAAWLLHVDVGLVTNRDEVLFLAVQAGDDRPAGFYEPIVVEGRMWDPTAVDELVVSERTAETFGFHVGSTVAFAGASPEQFADFERGVVPEEPEGGRLDFRVVGVVRDPIDALPFDTARLLTTPAYESALGDETGGVPLVAVRLARGEADLAAFRAATADLLGTGAGTGGPEVTSIHEQRRPVDSATSVAVRALLAFASAAGVAAAVALEQVLARNLLGPAAHLPTWSAVGMSTRARLLALVLPRSVVVAAGAATAVATAVALTPLTPVGVGGSVEPSPGFQAPWGLLALGATGVVVVLSAVVVASGVVVLRNTTGHAHGRPAASTTVVLRGAASGASLPFLLGAHFALQSSRARTGPRSRSAVPGAVLGVAGLAAAGTMLASVDRLATSPGRYGWGHDVSVIDVEEELLEELVTDDRHASVVDVRQQVVSLGDVGVTAFAFEVRRGGLDLSVLDGRLPIGPGEIALGPVLMDHLGVVEGDTVEARATAGGTVPLTVVGSVLTEGPDDFAAAAVVTADGLRGLWTEDGGYRLAWLTWADGVDGDAATAALAADKELGLPMPPADITNLHQARGVLRSLAAFLAALALAATGHAVALTVRRRRRDLGVLRAVGLTGRQLSRSIRWMAVVLLAGGVLVGVPVGVVTAGFLWRRIADGVGVAGDLALPAAALAATVPAALVAGVLLAAFPAHRAAQVGAVRALRVE